jgi:hypothetical protein
MGPLGTICAAPEMGIPDGHRTSGRSVLSSATGLAMSAPIGPLA